MPIEVVSYMLSSKDARKRLQSQLILQCAPFFKGVKISCITNVEKRLCGELRRMLEGTGIAYKILTIHKGKCLVFFYRKDEFEAYLERGDVKEFLQSFGYEVTELEKVLQKLSARACQFSIQGLGFPHEIGAFLDYPIEDVRSFIEKQGQEYLLTGYWKVYHNLAKAQMTFHAYDKAKTSAVNEFLAGKSIKDIVTAATVAA